MRHASYTNVFPNSNPGQTQVEPRLGQVENNNAKYIKTVWNKCVQIDSKQKLGQVKTRLDQVVQFYSKSDAKLKMIAQTVALSS